MCKHLILLLFLFLPLTAYSQFLKDLNYEIEAGVSFSKGKHTPLWLTANRQGLSSLQKNNGYLSAGVFLPTDDNRKFTYGLGLELAGAYNNTSAFIVQQAYFDLKYHFLQLSIGSKERFGELKNPLLSSGGMTFSGNARPVPQVRIGLPEYVTIPRTKDLLHIKGHVAYGRFTDDNFQQDFTQGKSVYNKDVLYHSKALYVKIGNDKTPVVFEGGLEMEAQFGGTVYHKNGNITKIPSRFIDYLKVFVPMSGDGETTGADQVNIYGNHLGSWNFSLEYKFQEWKFRGYYEHFFEDHSQMFWEYGFWKDCLAGLEVTFPKNRVISSFVYEYLGTKDQTGPFLFDKTEKIPDQVSANDNYYNHCSYSGWEHWGMGMGNPLLIAPLYNTNGSLSFRSNRVIAHHFGFMGKPISELGYRVLFTHARHWGTYYNPLPNVMNNNNGLLELIYTPQQLKHWEFTLSVAADKSNLIGNSAGGMLTVKFFK